jgi:hypothetical protein
MLRWTAHLRSRDRFGSRATWAALTEAPVYADGSRGNYGLGLLSDRHRGLPITHHSGGVTGGTAQMLTFPEHGLDLVLLANGGRDANVVELAAKAADIVLADRVGPETPKVPADEFKAALGDYWSPETHTVYSLADEKGSLTLALAKGPVGVPLQRGVDGWLICPGGGIGEIGVRPDGGDLEVRFGLTRLLYRRLEPAAGDAPAFAAAAAGRYYSQDADTTAIIAQDGEALTLDLSDGEGRVVAPLNPLSPIVAFSTPKGQMTVFRTTITLELDGGHASGFDLNTGRTRNLAFRRV